MFLLSFSIIIAAGLRKSKFGSIIKLSGQEGELMQLYTIQSRRFLKQPGTVLQTDIKYTTHWGNNFKIPYAFMRSEYQKRTQIKLSPQQALIWAWDQPVADRQHWLDIKRKPLVYIKFQAPDDLCLLSDFQAFHVLLNDLTFTPQPRNKYQDWQKLFDDPWLEKHDWRNAQDEHQVVLPYLKRSWIQKVKYFRT